MGAQEQTENNVSRVLERRLCLFVPDIDPGDLNLDSSVSGPNAITKSVVMMSLTTSLRRPNSTTEFVILPSS